MNEALSLHEASVQDIQLVAQRSGKMVSGCGRSRPARGAWPEPPPAPPGCVASRLAVFSHGTSSLPSAKKARLAVGIGKGLSPGLVHLRHGLT
jgi:hypothetical protein